jgi:lipoprotein-anchoring transpeptidase ErfK/SrfK
MKRRAFLLLPLLTVAFNAQAAKFGEWNGDEAPGTIIIITSDHTLHYIDDYGSRISYPIAVGKEGAQWTGVTRVTHKRQHPEWRPTPNMRAKDPSLPVVVKPGPKNPMGTRAIYLAEGYLRIHGTNSPKSIGKDASSGCYRMYNDDVEELFEMVSPGAEVIVLP